MSSRSLFVLMVAATIAICGYAVAPAAKVDSYSPPRLSDGTPDFRGIWQARTTAYMNVEGHAAGGGTSAVRSVVVDPPDGKIPYLPEALKQRDKNYRDRAIADPANNCFQAGVPRTVLMPTPFQIVQSVGNLRSCTRKITPIGSSCHRRFHTTTASTFSWAIREVTGRAARLSST